MRVMQVFIFFIAALSTIRPATGQWNTELVVYPLGSSNTTINQPVPVGSTIVFSCTIPGLDAYTGWSGVTYTELHAIVGVYSDITVCHAYSWGTCASNYQGAPYASRSIGVYVPTTVGTSFTMTAAAATDSVSYYCTIYAGNAYYPPAMGVTTPLVVYAVASQPTLSFVSDTSVFVSGQALPQIRCSANVGAPYGWLQLTATGFIGNWTWSNQPYPTYLTTTTAPYPSYLTTTTAPYPSYLTLVSNSTALQSDGTYTITYTFAYSSGTYTLSNNNINDYFVCFAYNSYTYQYVSQSGIASSALTIQVQYSVTDIAVSLPSGSSLSQYLVQSGTSYTLKVSQGTVVTLYCSAQGNPTPTYQWTRLYGQNAVTQFSSQVNTTLNIVETLTLQCVASNTVSASSLPFITSQTAIVNVVVVEATTATYTTTTAEVATAGLSGGVIAGFVITAAVAIAFIIALSVWCSRYPPKLMKKGEITKAPHSQQVLHSPALQSAPFTPFDQSIIDTDVPVEYDELRNYVYMNSDAVANGAPVSSQPMTPTASTTVPITYSLADEVVLGSL